MNTLDLRTLFTTYKKVNKSKRNEIFYNEFMNNLIIFSPYDKSCNTESICNGISDEAYMYLIKYLNTTKNIIVHWSQVEGTTSDYTIFLDHDPSTFKHLPYTTLLRSLESKRKTNTHTKYQIVQNGGYSIPISREEMLLNH